MLIHFVLGLYSVSAPSTELNCKCVLHRPRFGLFLELQLHQPLPAGVGEQASRRA